MADQHVCRHGHAYYDAARGTGSRRRDGWHDGQARHLPADTSDWWPWERDAYDDGWRRATACYHSSHTTGGVSP